LVCCEMPSLVLSKLKKARCRRVSWMSHSNNSLTKLILAELDICPSFFEVQLKYNMNPMLDKHMWYPWHHNGSFTSDVVRMNKITFNINKYIQSKHLMAPINILGLPWAIVFLLWASQHMSPRGTVFLPNVSFEEENISLGHHKRCFPRNYFFP
jgi:hypothetical protein